MAVAYVSAQGGLSSSGSSGLTTFTLTLGAAVSAGSAICIGAAGAPSSGTLTHWTVTDNASGNTYTRADDVLDPAGLFEAAIFYGVNIKGGPTTLILHATTGTFSFPALLADVFTGVSIVSPLDGEQDQVQGPPGPGTGANAISSGNFSPATSGDLIWGYTANEGSTGGDAAGTGFTQGRTDSASYTSEYKLSGVTGSQAVTFTNSTHGGDAGNIWLTSGMALKAAVPTTLSPPQKQWAWVPNAPAFSSSIQTVQKRWAWVGNAPVLGSALTAAQKAWQWVANAPSVSHNSTVQTVQKQWAWVGNAPAINHALQTVLKQWAWVGNAPTLLTGSTITAAQKAWAWVANAPRILTGTTLQTVQKQWVWAKNTPVFSTMINPPKAMWAWVARAPILSGGNIPHKVKEAFNVIRPVVWGVVRGVLTWPTIGPEQ